ncbi:MAG TPA: MarR family transcriptional regulator [Dehalococcoidia bacterium]|nr:MarR family transcriptional regulator [Dehalococcoidia bacterium]
MTTDRGELVQQILKLSEDIYNSIPLNIPSEWLESDLSVAQLRILLVLQSQGPSRMSSIASVIGVALPTATGVVDNLVRKGLVIRENTSEDRRVVICSLSPQGQELINKLWMTGRFQMVNLLDGLTMEQLEKAHEVARMLYENVSRKLNGNKGNTE